MVVSLILVPLIRVASRATAPPKPPQGWDELSWEEEAPEQEQEPARLGYQSIDIPPEQEGERSIVMADPNAPQTQDFDQPSFDLRAAVVAETILNAKYKDE